MQGGRWRRCSGLDERVGQQLDCQGVHQGRGSRQGAGPTRRRLFRRPTGCWMPASRPAAASHLEERRVCCKGCLGCKRQAARFGGGLAGWMYNRATGNAGLALDRCSLAFGCACMRPCRPSGMLAGATWLSSAQSSLGSAAQTSGLAVPLSSWLVSHRPSSPARFVPPAAP